MANKNIKRIRIHMVDDWEEYAKDYPKVESIDENNKANISKSNVWHILLSNCYKYSNWLETAIDNCFEGEKTELMIMDDTNW